MEDGDSNTSVSDNRFPSPIDEILGAIMWVSFTASLIGFIMAILTYPK